MRKQPQMGTKSYPYIQLWGREIMGSYQSYIDREKQLAAQEGAPHNAISRNQDGTWATTDDITSKSTRLRMGLEPIERSPARIVIEYNDGTKEGWELHAESNQIHTTMVRQIVDQNMNKHYEIGV